jgi:hypothetical protein
MDGDSMIVNHQMDLDSYGAGFYCVDAQDNLLYAPTAVYAPDYTLLARDRSNYTYPMHGWYWFESYEQAVAQWAIEVAPTPEETVNTLLQGLDQEHIDALRSALG